LILEEILIKNLGKIIFVVLLFGLVLATLNAGFAASSVNKSASNWEGTNQLSADITSNYAAGSDDSPKTIKVLIYSGSYAAYSCVTGIKTALNSANTNNLTPGYKFTYATSTVINSATLSGYDVLAMPGGSSGYDYMHSSGISGTAIKSFISSGHGYLGICAGAYSGSYRVIDYYYGWNLANDVTCTHPNHEGKLLVKITPAGQEILNDSGTVTMVHYNGPAMYVKGNAIAFATYADTIIKSKGMAAIVGDFYGKGRTVLCGPHPELAPQLPGIVANMIVWAANITSSPNPESTNTAYLSQIASAAGTVKSQYEKNKELPSYVTINGNQLSMSQFIYLLAKGIVNVNSGNFSSIMIKTVNAPTAPSSTYKSGNINKSTYLALTKSLLTYINKYGRAPNYQTTTLGKISYTRLVYMYSKIMKFYKTNYRLPNFVTI
jgi:glutamine amidotransferase-like uncharacterized protein